MSQIELRNICKKFENKRILHHVNLLVQEGEMISLLGPSGCGKTTTLKIIAGLMEPDAGDILFNDTSILNIPVEKRGAIIVFQDYLLFPHLTVEENIEFGLKMAKVKKSKRREKVREMIDLVQLEGHEKKYPKELSGGQKQRVAIARALAIEPKVLLLDEPFSNLDTRLREIMREFICDIQRKFKITMILVTHDKEEALMTSSKIAVMLDGEIKQFGTPKEIYERPVSSLVADFFGEKNYVDGEIKEGIFYSIMGSFQTGLHKNGRVRAMIRPEEIEITPKGNIAGIIKNKTYAGEKIYYIIDCNGKRLKCITNGKTFYNIGEKINVYINFDNIVFFER
ncbi:ABC transporter ATP-binding protein [Thermotalea metallivorans]|uniref:ABC-type quaternary amine transporter n=1 Tax=Thermotalea metallivorans TaxID=520762 RepID=A0A140KZZ1_9FIRM|nr:ABC transporter ATP-binding protein [Thermotalea metallivorans]KXG73866.1 Spermidine/putrescine import ATP-binding protein PotA [Thermotalea metallivorans]